MFSTLFPILWTGERHQPIVYLTFDDGPEADVTPGILDVLRTHHVAATFFLVGSKAERMPSLLERMSGEGHAIGNHSFSHRRLIFKSKRRIDLEISQTNRIIQAATGQIPCFFRPPHGHFGPSVLASCTRHRMRLVLWNLTPRDYKKSISPSDILYRVERKIRNGRIILLHDTIKTLKLLPELINEVKKQDFTFSTLNSIK
ncbi:polysaccharide deacetylase family protein [candidate division KSB1 bacterium]|nr:polysaccharide deacetylase family protein [candidate division KSB1 bacterium]